MILRLLDFYNANRGNKRRLNKIDLINYLIDEGLITSINRGYKVFQLIESGGKIHPGIFIKIADLMELDLNTIFKFYQL